MKYKVLLFVFVSSVLGLSKTLALGENYDGNIHDENNIDQVREHNGKGDTEERPFLHLDVGGYFKGFEPRNSDVRFEHSENPRHILRRGFLPHYKLANEVVLTLGKTRDHLTHEKEIPNTENLQLSRESNDQSEAGVEVKQQLGQWSLEEGFLFRRFSDFDNRETDNESFYGGNFGIRKNTQLRDDLSSQVSLNYDLDRRYVPAIDEERHDLENISGKVLFVGPKWFFEGNYQNQYVDKDDDYYQTQATAARYWFGASGEVHAMLATGLQYRRVNLNSREALGLYAALSLRTRELTALNDYPPIKWLEDVTKSGVDLIIFVDPTGGSEGDAEYHAFEGKLRMMGSLREFALQGRPTNTTSWIGGEAFFRKEMGEASLEEVSGGQFFLMFEY